MTCTADAALFGCHLAPQGFSSWDQSVYMLWNGHFAATQLINAFEYTRDAGAARAALLPLLDAGNALWACALNRSATGLPPPHDYVYRDTRGDEEHEKGAAADPQIGLAFVARTLAAQLDASSALNSSSPLLPVLADILAHLISPNTDAGCVPDPKGRWACGGFNCECAGFSGLQRVRAR